MAQAEAQERETQSERGTTQRETQSASSATRQPNQGQGQGGRTLDSGQGATTIASSVVTKIASIAAKEVSGVHELGGNAARTFGAIRERIPGSGGPSTAQGVSVEVGERQAAIDLVVVVEYGVPIAEVAKGVRRNLISSVENMTGLEVVEVNVNVVDIYIPGVDTVEEPKPTRVE